jgi:hypothetical protein
VPAIPPEQLAASVYLIGDAGAPAAGGEPVLEALTRELRAGATKRVVVFLGDNVYPRGLPAPDHPDRPEAERRLAAQVEAVTQAGATGYFVLGNHDSKGEDRWEAARRQARYIDSAGGGLVRLRPEVGCPGPSLVDIGDLVRVVMLDTEWWLHEPHDPAILSSGCPANTASEVVDSLRAAIRGAGGRLVLIAAHHPLTTGGVHGGYFGWKDHLFPLQVVVPGLWLPLPFLGSLYPAARQHGISSQDVPSPAYQRLIAALRRAFADAQPALYAAGHEHNLQVIAGGLARLELVSGSGIYGHSGRAVAVEGTLFARKASGFARLFSTWVE